VNRLALGVLAFLSIAIAVLAPLPWLLGLFEDLSPRPPLVDHLLERLHAVPVVFLLHVVAGAVALATGPWQLMPRLRARRPRLHRATGYVYVTAVAIAGVAGLVMAATAWGGPVARLGFAGLAIAWLATTGLGLHRIVTGDRAGHRAWITRSFALAFAAVSLRLQAQTFVGLGLSDAIAYPIIAWSSWVPNLIVVQRILRRSSAGEVPVQRRNARVNELCSENPSR
jgi:uncharacterized membrane protein